MKTECQIVKEIKRLENNKEIQLEIYTRADDTTKKEIRKIINELDIKVEVLYWVMKDKKYSCL